MGIVVVAVVAAVAATAVRLLQKYLRWRKLLSLPGPKSSFLLGQLPEVRSEPYFQPHQRWWAETGYDTPLIRYSMILGSNRILCLDPEIVKEIITAPASKDTARFYKPKLFLKDLLGDGLVTIEGDQWSRHRKLIQPAFSVAFIIDCLNESVPPKVEQFVKLWGSKDAQGREIDLSSHLSALTLDIIGDVGFSHNFSGMTEIEKWVAAKGDEQIPEIAQGALSDSLIRCLTEMQKPNLLRIMFFVTGLFSWDAWANPKTISTLKELNNAATGIIENARKKASSLKSKSVIQLLLDARQAPSPSLSSSRTKSANKSYLDDTELRDELKTFLLAGHETTATWIYWGLYALSKWRDIQEKVYEDVMKHSPGGRIGMEEVGKMEYLNAFLNEVLRFFPPVGMMLRLNKYEETFAGYKIPPETMLVIPVHLLHRHPRYWENPNTFLPERWLDEPRRNSGSGFGNRGCTFLPFSSGARNCIGYRFATIEVQMIVATIIRSLRVEIAPSQRDTKFVFTAMVIMKAKPTVKIVVKPR